MDLIRISNDNEDLMNIHLTPELERLVQSKVQAGHYKMVREALRLMEERDQIVTLRKGEIRRKIAQGLKSLRKGKGVDGEAVFDRIEAELEALERSGK